MDRLAERLIALGFIPRVDFRVLDDGEGPYLHEWMSDKPQPTEDEVKAVVLPGDRRMVPKSVVISRLTDDQLAAAKELFRQSPRLEARWYAADHPSVYADDPDALALLKAIGADPAKIMAE